VRRIATRGLLATGFLSLAGGVGLGLVRLGWNVPLLASRSLLAHGPLMVCGFLGTLICLERAVAVGTWWAFAAPLAIATGALALGLDVSGAWPVTVGSGVLVAIFVVIGRQQPSLFVATMALGALAWFIGNVRWLSGAALHRVVFWWLAFLVLTIAGERLELNRVLRPSRFVRASFAVAIAVVLSGAVVGEHWPEEGVRVLGAGLLLLTVWLARYDVARRTVHQRGLTRFMAISLLGGYVWLAVGGTVGVMAAPAVPGLLYDALLHSVFLGFVMSMVFAHAPVILPAVVKVGLQYRPRFYVPVVVLHVSMAVRLFGDLVDVLGRIRAWSGLLTALAFLLFVASIATSIHARDVE
jgi:hypothetical protein